MENSAGPKYPCPICLEDFMVNKVGCITPCQHVFMEECLHGWVSYRVSHDQPVNCPICREPLHWDDVKPLVVLEDHPVSPPGQEGTNEEDVMDEDGEMADSDEDKDTDEEEEMSEEEEEMDGEDEELGEEDEELSEEDEDAIGEESEEDEDDGGPDEADEDPDYMEEAEYEEEDEMDGEEHGDNGEEEEDIVLVAEIYYGEVHVVADVHADL